MATCFSCNNSFYAKCFGVDHQLLPRLNSPDHCVRFVCGNCILKPRRKSLSTPAEETISKDTHLLNDNIKELLNLMRTPASSYQNNTARIDNNDSNKSNEQTKIEDMQESLLKLHEKIDLQNANRTTDEDRRSVLLEKIDSLHRKMDSSTTTKNQKPQNTPINKLKQNPLDWSFQFAPSATQIVDNSDIYPLLAGFESNTWSSLDYISKKVVENNEMLMNLQSLISDETTLKKDKSSGDSALATAINIDALHEISQKCDQIENKLNHLASDNRFTGNPHTVNKPIKEAMTQTNYQQNNVPETLNDERQKRQMPNLPGEGPGIDSIDSNRMDGMDINEAVNQQESFTQSTQNLGSTQLEPEVLDVMNDLDNENSQEIEDKQETCALNNHFRITKFSTNTTTSNILQYIEQKSKLQINPNEMIIIRLTKKGQDLSLLKYVNFKIETTDKFVSIINNKSFWPHSVNISPWKVKPNRVCNFQADLDHQNMAGNMEQNFQFTLENSKTSRCTPLVMQ